ncbi:MAG: hypothetical protein IJA12_06635 [Oscillospiraceae bacterium]|nr:hypothetical protein [Oscillospiraceae bacterium]
MSNKNFLNSEDTTGNFDTNDIENNKVLAAIGYIPVLFLIPLLASPSSPYAKFHANQGLILTLAAVALGIARSVLCSIFGFIPLIRVFIPEIISTAVSLAVLAYIIIGVVNAATGKARKLPFIGDFLNIIH